METATSVVEMREKRQIYMRRRWAAMGRRPIIGLTPTMGALHAGHASLLAAMGQDCDVRLASIFVNPRQFDSDNDLDRYPRTIKEDLDLCEAHGVDLVFVPEPETLYPSGYQTAVACGALTSRWEGQVRPGHFDGVTTVVAKLLSITTPDVAYFGEKDFQQLRIVQQMALDLDFDVHILPCPTVREPDGLAISSRNQFLTPEKRKFAPQLYRALEAAQQAFAEGEHNAQILVAKAGHELAGWKEDDLRVDYLQVVDSVELEPREEAQAGDRLIAAVQLGNVRLIDNIELREDVLGMQIVGL